MATIVINIIIDDVEDVVALFDKIKVYRATTEAGAYSEISTSSTRPTIVSGTTSYSFTDSSGSASYYYRTSYYNSSTGAESSLSDPQPGESDPAYNVITIQELKDIYLFGVNLTNDFGADYPESMYRQAIRQAVSWAESKLDIAITPRQFYEEHDFQRDLYRQYIWIKVDKVPVISLDEVRLVLPSGYEAINYPDEWFYSQKFAGQNQIVPGNGDIAILALGTIGSWLPMLQGWGKFIPNAFRVTYTAGFGAGQVPAAIKELVGLSASIPIFNVAGDLIAGAGIASQSLSLDGLSQSINTTSSATNSGYGARIIQYQKQIKDLVATLRAEYHPISLEIA